MGRGLNTGAGMPASMRIILPGVIVLASFIDWILTLRLLASGATEVNPVMNHLMDFAPWLAVTWKMVMCIGGAILLSCLWSRKLARGGLYGLALIYSLLVAYEFVLLVVVA